MIRKWTPEERQFILDKYLKEGWTLKEIAEKFHSKSNTISKYIKLWGYEIKRKGTISNRRLNENYFSKIDTEIKAYFIGLLFADGSVILGKNGRSSSISLELIETDKNILDLLKKELNSDGNLYYNKRKNRQNGTFTFSVRNQKIADDLSKFNIIPNKTYKANKIVVPVGFEKDFLRGFIDGDGSIYKHKKDNSWHLSITGHSYEIIKQFSELMNNLIDYKKDKKITLYNNVYRYILNGQYAIKLMDLLYADANIYITRKRDLAMLAVEDKKS